jgi:hypothetical protein
MERRIALRRPIRCRIECKTGNETFLADGFDMSDTGVSFATARALPQNTEVVLHYRLEDDGPMITAKVVICQQTGGRYGARFVDHKSAAHNGASG